MKIVFIIAIILAATLIAVLFAAKQNASHKFRCKSCDFTFQPEWKTLLFASHSDDVYEISCPKCGKKGCSIENN